MRDKNLEGHAPGCDGTCNDIHTKADVVRSVENSFKAIRQAEEPLLPLTPEGSFALDWGLAQIRDIASDPTIPEAEMTIAAMQTIAVRVSQIAGIRDLLRRSAVGIGAGSRLN